MTECILMKRITHLEKLTSPPHIHIPVLSIYAKIYFKFSEWGMWPNGTWIIGLNLYLNNMVDRRNADGVWFK